jgi:prepilin-type N-terminal cleavage/methylation domain-containing protein
MSRSRHAFTLVEILVVVAIAGVMAALAVPSFVTGNTIRKQQEAELQIEAGLRLARDTARTELRCVTVGTRTISAGVFELVGTAHVCPTGTAPYAPPYSSGVPAVSDHELFRVPLVGTSLEVLEQTCAPPSDCPATPGHTYGALYEVNPDGSLDHPYVVRLTHVGGAVRTWDIHSATGTVRKR